MRKLITLKTAGVGAAAAMTMALMTATPVSAQSYGGDPLLGAILRGVLIATGDNSRYGSDQGRYRGENCRYYRDGRCYRNVGHWEREHGINSRNRDYGYGYGNGYGQGEYQEGRTYSNRGYYRDGRFWRNHGEWRSYQNHARDYRYDRRW